jgi:putative FmdB family regulatory protein
VTFTKRRPPANVKSGLKAPPLGMPIYEFKCEECGAVYERLCRTADDVKGRCPECGSAKSRRLVSRVAATTSKPRAGEACIIKAG